jgi:membrane protease subunit HflK
MSGESDATDGVPDGDPVAPIGAAAAAAWARVAALFRLPHVGRGGAWLLVGLLLIGWVASGIFKVGPDEQGVVLRFGRLAGIEQPGLHYHLPFPIDTVLLPRVTAVNELRSTLTPARDGASRMLTGDENIVEAEYSVLWKIKDAGAFLFHTEDPEAIARMAAETAMREVIGRNPIQAALSDQREQIAAAAQQEMQSLLDAYGTGILVIGVQLQRVDPPPAVIDAFNDVQRARADQVRARNEADAYRNDVLPRARGEADHVVQQAEAYRTQAVDQAQGDVSAFLSAYDAYRRAPQVFAWRLYLDSMDDLLRHASRVVIDAAGNGVGNVLPLLPLGEPPVAPAAAKPAARP